MKTLFTTATNKAAYAKIGIMGAAGSGKSYTASSIAIGLVGLMRAGNLSQGAKPVMFIDSENGSSWMVARFEEAGVPLQVAQTTAFSDLADAMNIARDQGSVLIIDSITAFWVEFTEAYKLKKKRLRGLEFQDWGWLKQEWRQKFTNRFLNDPIHVIMCGRQGYEYDTYTDDTGKKQIEKSGVKMKAEGELGFEPSLLIQMEREHDLASNRVKHVAHILKDRRADGKTLDGKSFPNPTFKTFMPHFECLNLGGDHVGFDESRSTAGDIEPDQYDRRRTDRDIVLDQISDILTKHYTASVEHKVARITILENVFGTSAKTALEKRLSLEELQFGYDQLCLNLDKKQGPYGKANGKIMAVTAESIDDSIPDFPGDTQMSDSAH